MNVTAVDAEHFGDHLKACAGLVIAPDSSVG